MGHINNSNKSQRYGFLSFVMGARIFKFNSSVRQGAQIFRPIDFGLLTSQIKKASAKCSGLVALQLLAVLTGGFLCFSFFSDSAYAASYVNVSSGGSGETAGVVSLGKIKPSSSGSTATGNDTLTVHTDCSAGYKVYVSGQNGKTTNLTNQSATDPSNPSSSDIISASSNTIASPNTLSSNTWGISGNSTDIENHLYAGLPSYASATSASLVTKSDVAEESTVPIYYGVKADTTLNPGTYSGDILYTVLMDTSCIPYTVEFSPNVEQSSESEITGETTAQSILPNSATALTANAYEREGYTFLGWSTTPEGKTGNVTNGIGTTEDVDYDDEAEVTNLTTGGSSITLYAIWEVAPTEYMQDFMCSSLGSGKTKTLVDKRDDQEYTVYRIPTDNAATDVAGKCIMTKDLNLGAVNSVSGSSSTITANGTMTLSPEDSTFSTPTGSGESITVPTSNVTVSMTWNTSDSYSNRHYHTNGTGNYAGRGYYSWGAAMVACPKGWRLPTQDELNNNNSYWNASTTGISKAVNNSLSTLQSSPWSFVLGGEYYNGFSKAGSYGYYWSSTQYDSSSSYELYLFSSDGLIRSNSSKRNGFAVRCMADDNFDGIMQDFDANDLATGQTMRLKDVRDGKIYSAKKLEDGEVWMMDNLAISNVVMTNADTNLEPGATFDLTSNITYSGSSGWCQNSNASCVNTKAVYIDDTNGGYYNWYTATAGNGSYYNQSIFQFNYDICPKGWRLPIKGSDDSYNQFILLDKALNSHDPLAGNNRLTSSSGVDQDALQVSFNNMVAIFPLGGSIDGSLGNVDSRGFYWSGAAQSSSDAGYFALSLSSLNVVPKSSNYKYIGGSVRCVAQSPVVINYHSNDGEGQMASQTITATSDLAPNTFTKDGYTFLGWSRDKNATTAEYRDRSPVYDLANKRGTVDLYAVWEKPDGDMQSWLGCGALSDGDTLRLRDIRDNTIYTIRKFDTECYMVENLTLGYDKGYALTSETTNIPDTDSTVYYLPAAGKRGSITSSSTVDISNTDVAFTGDDDQAHVQYASKQTLSSIRSYLPNVQATGYYNFYAATLGKGHNGSSGTPSDYPSSGRDICPRGWQLPVDSGESKKSWYYFYNTLNDASSTRMVDSAYANLPYSGYYDYNGYFQVQDTSNSNGSVGYWWTSDLSSYNGGKVYSYYLYTSSNGISPQANGVRSRGLAVRCVAQSDGTTMQGTVCSGLPIGQTSTLTDARDNQEYTIYRWAATGKAGNYTNGYPVDMAGYCIMTKDMSLGYITGGEIEKDADLGLKTDTTSVGTNINIAARPNGNGWINDRDYRQYTNGPKVGNEAETSHSYYSYNASLVCPKGWHTPSKEQYTNIVSFLGGNNETASIRLQSEPYNFNLGGFYYNGWNSVGAAGYYWANSQWNNDQGYGFQLNSTGAGYIYQYKYVGFAVRCIATP
ncbi:InlB B-repeat-containing protein [Candidatus Saccharibacteria bacterium]|nr:InlB B-repeat-containing protein [Candidatus Saccharibacteria bacterium]